MVDLRKKNSSVLTIIVLFFLTVTSCEMSYKNRYVLVKADIEFHALKLVDSSAVYLPATQYSVIGEGGSNPNGNSQYVLGILQLQKRFVEDSTKTKVAVEGFDGPYDTIIGLSRFPEFYQDSIIIDLNGLDKGDFLTSFEGTVHSESEKGSFRYIHKGYTTEEIREMYNYPKGLEQRKNGIKFLKIPFVIHKSQLDSFQNGQMYIQTNRATIPIAITAD